PIKSCLRTFSVLFRSSLSPSPACLKKMQGGWQKSYVIAAMISFYFNVFVLVVQSFRKVPALHALAPNGSEPPFAIAQSIVLVAFVVFTILANKKFRRAVSQTA